MVWDLACPDLRKDAEPRRVRRHDRGSSRSDSANPTVLDDAVDDETQRRARRPRSVAHDDQRLVRFDVAPGSANPNPTMTAWFVHTGTGWLYCGMVPDA